ncbi:hypothetical protein PRIPAC_77775 [Pristionchus pacificus]|uniref:Uncharacterized protein n=1 Tax=Pristionchus pacificus TaxID=54126 RepID=A0A2A6C4B5_PRIPA|nr:hypothetical protein PRIPAC_77775 [Pristionchus pacificus]|eukprot:PDM72979.1 hypothetical protein PRIPAC_39413 [Pristionchus pacificus]
METDKQPIIDDLPSASKKEKCEALFEEEWSRIYPNELVITWYWFPTAQAKRIDTHQIKGIYYSKQTFCKAFGSVKSWGMSFSPCWWACDIKRCLRSNPEGNGFYNVVIDIGDGTMKGFTTANLQAFLTVLRRQCNPGVICQEGFPW